MSDDVRIKSADDLIVQEEAIKLGKPIPEIPKEENKQLLEKESAEEMGIENDEGNNNQEVEETDSTQENEEIEASNDSQNDEVDEYGTKIGKKKLYTEEEVQRMIRDRLKRGQHNESQYEVQNVAKDFTPDPESTESWEVQLETFIDQTISKREQKARDNEWKEREQSIQNDFEIKFTEGMSKYKDFASTVSNKPITEAMMLATRTMNDPAAFVYAACKQHPKELERIAQIRDPIAQSVEVGRLEERMKKSKSLSSSPKPAKLISGDTSNALPQLDIDARISQHAKSKLR